MKRETVAQAHARGYAEGFAAGVAKLEAERKANNVTVRTHQLELMKAVTQLVSVSGQTVQSLAQVYDNGPRN